MSTGSDTVRVAKHTAKRNKNLSLGSKIHLLYDIERTSLPFWHSFFINEFKLLTYFAYYNN